MSWLRAIWAWLVALFRSLAKPSGAWTVDGNKVTGTVTGALIDTGRPIVDQNSTPRTWTVSPDKTSFSTSLGG